MKLIFENFKLIILEKSIILRTAIQSTIDDFLTYFKFYVI